MPIGAIISPTCDVTPTLTLPDNIACIAIIELFNYDQVFIRRHYVSYADQNIHRWCEGLAQGQRGLEFMQWTLQNECSIPHRLSCSIVAQLIHSFIHSIWIFL